MFRKKRSRGFLYFIFLLVFIFTVNRFVLSFSDILKHSYSVILYPVFLSQQYFINPVKKVFEQRRSRRELENLVYRLSRDNDNIIAENVRLRATQSYYDQISEVLEFKNRYKTENLYFCKVIFKHINKNSHFIYVDKGFSNGLQKGMVAVYNNFLLGKIVEAYEYYSKVLLVTDKSCKVSAYCQNCKVSGINEGINYPDQMVLNRISHLETVSVGDIVLSSGQGLIFPQGFALGKVFEVQKGELYNTIKVAPLFDIKNISYCFVMKKGQTNILEAPKVDGKETILLAKLPEAQAEPEKNLDKK